VTAAGGNIGEWVSPYGIIPLVNNNAWRIRANMSSNQTTALSGPLWDIIIRNLNIDGSVGDDAYLADYFWFDNTGSANRIGTSPGLTTFDLWYAPSPLLQGRWRSTSAGAFTGANDARNDLRLNFRVLDSDSAGIGGEVDSGQICLTGLTIDRFDLSKLYVTGNADVYNLNPVISGINGVRVIDLLTQFGITSGAGSTKDFSTAPLTIGPADPLGWLTEITGITPGDNNDPVASSPAYGTGTDTIDNYPIVWEGNVLYQLLVELTAPDATSETNGPDAIRLGFDAKSIEIFADSYITTGMGAVGMPKRTTSLTNGGSGTALGIQTYTMFLWSHNATLSPVPNIGRLRPRIDIMNTTNFNRPTAGVLRNLGSVRIHSIKVRKVQFYGM
jgi:hypothetical protein